MNAAVRAVVRTAAHQGVEVFAVRHGFAGLISGQFCHLRPRDVSGIIQRGGTVLGTSRCPEFLVAEGRHQALHELEKSQIDGLVVVGGNGSQTASHLLATEGLSVVGVSSTIDNDLAGTDVTIGCTTALDVALEAIDRLRVTATSIERAFLVEVMGRNSGYLALMAAIGGAAEAVVIPEVEVDPEAIAQELSDSYLRGKSSAIVVVAEGASYNADRLAAYFKEHHARIGFDLRVTRLGHVQRGGSPGFFDRYLATRLGNVATEALLAGEAGVLAGWIRGEAALTPLSEVAGVEKHPDPSLLDLARILAR
jgi:6-phosphofructokinase 1